MVIAVLSGGLGNLRRAPAPNEPRLGSSGVMKWDIAGMEGDFLHLIAPIVTFGCGAVLLGYTDYAEAYGWKTGPFFERAALSNGAGLLLMAWGLVLTWPLGWESLPLTLVGVFAFS